MIPRMRPSSTRMSMPSSATVLPNALRSARASMHAIVSALLFAGLRSAPFSRAIQQVLWRQSKALNVGLNLRPFFRQEFLPFALQQQVARSRLHEHSQASPALDKIFVDQLLVTLENRERVDAIF